MSFNPSLHITRANYEEYFLLYVDNELAAEDRAAVEAFAVLHPDLQEELAMLLDTRLEPESLPLLDKSSLLAPGISAAALEEDLLCYIDGELPEAARAELESLLRTDRGLQAGHAALLAAKLDPLDTVACPFKNELYREEPARRRAFGPWRAAAAVLLIAGAGSAYGLLNGSSTPGTVAHTGHLPQATAADAPATGNPSPRQADPALPSKATVAYGGTPAAVNVAEAAATVSQRADQKGSIARAERRKPAAGTAPTTATRNAQAALAASGAPEEAYAAASLPGRVSSLDAQPLSQQQNINSSPVTDAHLAAYTPMNDAGSEASTASASSGKQGSVRGFLRKATRFIERRTGIKTTNDDDQLVIATVAINLK
ncbi:MAG: hypothetical protein EOO11_07870 [Chitinophagaceae bacterium]|nr:MAG: hypothetical protein EOO11_07870 [Chitinophagaceae bacterium]